MRTVDWDDREKVVRMIDQRLLPGSFKVNSYQDYRELAAAIRDMVVRGAPAIGASAAFGLALAANYSRAATPEAMIEELRQASDVLMAARPTAVNLAWALHQILDRVEVVEFEGVDESLRQQFQFHRNIRI